MDEFYLPYHFVPMAKGGRNGDLPSGELRKGREGKIENVRHDRYEAGTRSGTIRCLVEAVSPIFIGDKRGENQEQVLGFKLDGKPALPASSLRGLVASVAEAASNSAARVLSPKVLGQPCYSYRKPMQKPLSAVGLLSKEGTVWKLEPVCLPLLQYDRGHLRPEMNKWKTIFAKEPVFRVFVGDSEWIRRAKDDPSDAKKKRWSLRTTSTPKQQLGVRQLTWAEVATLGPVAKQHLIAKPEEFPQTVVAQKWVRNESQQPCLIRVLGCYEVNDKGSPLRQIPDQKKHELFLPYQAGRFQKLMVPGRVIDKFQQLADQMTEDSKAEPAPRPYEPKETRPSRKPGERLQPREGDLVFFDVDDRQRVTEIAYSSIWRGRVETPDGKAANSWTFFQSVDPQLTPFHAGRTQITLAERIFGFVEEEKDGQELRNGLRLKGRVRFGPALAVGEVRELPLTPLKELSSPKPPSPALYFRRPQGENSYIAKGELKPGMHWPQGRKMYLHHAKAITENAKPWENDGKFEPKRHVKVRPWDKGSRWRFEIRFDNLDDLELGLLLYALSPSEEFRHKIGMGKPLGLGSVHLKVEQARLVDRQTRYSAAGWGAPRYGQEEFAWRSLRDQYRDRMVPEIRAALEELGNPAKLDRAVEITYPRVIGQRGEEDLYQWFVSNDQQKDKAQRVALQPVAVTPQGKLSVKIEPLPRLLPPRG